MAGACVGPQLQIKHPLASTPKHSARQLEPSKAGQIVTGAVAAVTGWGVVVVIVVVVTGQVHTRHPLLSNVAQVLGQLGSNGKQK